MLISGLFDTTQLSSLKCDAVYVGIEGLSHRCVKYFPTHAIAELGRLAHRKHKHLYVMLNRLYEEHELESLELFIKNIIPELVDGLVYSNHAVLVLANKYGLQGKLIHQADTLITNQADAWFYAQRNQYVMLAKEITLTDVQLISQQHPEHFGMIIHGYLNLSYSKRPLLSNYSSLINQELSVDHLYYLQEETRELKMPIIEELGGTSIYSGYVLCSLEHLDEIIPHVKFLWIDPIFMTSDQQELVVDLYHQVLNGQLTADLALQRLPSQYVYSDGFYHSRTWKTKQEANNA